MKKIAFSLVLISLLSSCSMFRKSEKVGCPSNGRNVGAEKILAGDKEASKAGKAKFKGGR